MRMKVARVSNGRTETYGFVRDGMIAIRDEITCATGVPIPYSVKDFLFDGWYDEVSGKLGELPYGNPLSEYTMLPPIPDPGKILCLAFNYASHIREQGVKTAKDPVLVMKPRTALNGAYSDIVCPDFVTQLDYEVELAVVIGKTCKNVEAGKADDVIFGYMVFNDVSARDIQFTDMQFTRAKGFDTFAPCGPWITTADEIADVNDLKMTTHVNGSMRQNATTGDMVLKIPEVISKISRVMTLEKGDIISTGTPSGVVLGRPDGVFLKDGDVIDMEIGGLGTMRNGVRFAGPGGTA